MTLVFVALCPLAFAQAQSKDLDSGRFTGSQLRDYCRLVSQDISKMSREDAHHMNNCLYFIEGVIDGYNLADGKPDLCIPDGSGVTFGQLALVVSKYVEDHPEQLHLGSGALVLNALYRAFPCKASHTG